MKIGKLTPEFFHVLEREMGYPKKEPPIDKIVETAIRLRNTGNPLDAVQAGQFCDTVWWAIQEEIKQKEGRIISNQRRALGLLSTTQNALNN